MNFIINSDVLAKHVAVISKAQSGKNALPILDCILIEQKDGKVRLTASDAENYLSCELDAVDYSGDMKIALDSRKLYSGIREIGDQPITIETINGSEVCVVYQNGKYNLMSGFAQDYPENMLRAAQSIGFTVSSGMLKTGLGHCVWAVGNDELRPQMNGVYFDTCGSSFVMVGTDGHKLVRDTFGNPENITGASFIILPKAIKLIKEMISKDEEQTVTINVAEDKRAATFYIGEYTLSSRLEERKYPNYNSVIPSDLPLRAVVSKVDLRTIVNRVSVFSSNVTDLLKFRFEPGMLTVSSEDIDFSTSAEEHMNIDYEGEPVSIGFGGAILKQLLGEMPGDTVNISMTAPSRPAIFTPVEESESGEDVLMLLMPMMLQGQ